MRSWMRVGSCGARVSVNSAQVGPAFTQMQTFELPPGGFEWSEFYGAFTGDPVGTARVLLLCAPYCVCAACVSVRRRPPAATRAPDGECTPPPPSLLPFAPAECAPGPRLRRGARVRACVARVGGLGVERLRACGHGRVPARPVGRPRGRGARARVCVCVLRCAFLNAPRARLFWLAAPRRARSGVRTCVRLMCVAGAGGGGQVLYAGSPWGAVELARRAAPGGGGGTGPFPPGVAFNVSGAAGAVDAAPWLDLLSAAGTFSAASLAVEPSSCVCAGKGRGGGGACAFPHARAHWAYAFPHARVHWAHCTAECARAQVPGVAGVAVRPASIRGSARRDVAA